MNYLFCNGVYMALKQSLMSQFLHITVVLLSLWYNLVDSVQASAVEDIIPFDYRVIMLELFEL